jgi:hypothetical protein
VKKLNLEISQGATVVPTVLGAIEIKAFQIVASVRLSIGGQMTPDFPAIVDTGLNHNFAITEEHLGALGIKPDVLETIGWMKVLDRIVPLKAAELHLGGHPLIASSGISVWPGKHPRLPLLGMRALIQNKMRLVIDGRRCKASIGPSMWYH